METWLRPLFDAERMREADRWAIEDRGVPSLELMETAGRAVARVAGELATQGRVRVVCGKGNNGGDGLVAARALAETGYDVEAVLIWPSAELSQDAAANLKRFPSARPVSAADVGPALEGSGVVVDAIFGTGFEGAPRAPADGAIEAMNSCEAPTVAVDVASGVNASTGEVEGAAVRATATVTFHGAKIGHWVAPGKWCAGRVHVADIGIPPEPPVAHHAGLIDSAVLALAPRRTARSTKFTSGQVVIAGGSRGLTGAVCMAASAAIRCGAGYATVAVPASLEPIFETKLTEVMSVGCPDRDGALTPDAAERILDAGQRAAAMVLGPGLGRSDGAFDLARELATRIEAPLLIDADGLNALAGRLESLRDRVAPTVLTPHAGELGRLLERDSSEVSAHRLASARAAAEESGAIVVLKGDDTIVTDGRTVAVNGLSSPALATAGTGDVLSGTIAALLARGMEPFAAASAGALAGAAAGRSAAERLGAESVIAGDVIDSIPDGLRPGRWSKGTGPAD